MKTILVYASRSYCETGITVVPSDLHQVWLDTGGAPPGQPLVRHDNASFGAATASIKSVAEQCGFRTKSALRAAFKSAFGTSMREWRRREWKKSNP